MKDIIKAMQSNKRQFFKGTMRLYMKAFDIHHIGKYSDTGWKISVHGKSIDDAIEVLKMTFEYLKANNISFKVATIERINYKNEGKSLRHLEQSRKIMTIYCPNEMEILDLCAQIYQLTKNYKGWYDIRTPSSYEHYAGGLFFRCDRDENGRYIHPQTKIAS